MSFRIGISGLEIPVSVLFVINLLVLAFSIRKLSKYSTGWNILSRTPRKNKLIFYLILTMLCIMIFVISGIALLFKNIKIQNGIETTDYWFSFISETVATLLGVGAVGLVSLVFSQTFIRRRKILDTITTSTRHYGTDHYVALKENIAAANSEITSFKNDIFLYDFSAPPRMDEEPTYYLSLKHLNERALPQSETILNSLCNIKSIYANTIRSLDAANETKINYYLGKQISIFKRIKVNCEDFLFSDQPVNVTRKLLDEKKYQLSKSLRKAYSNGSKLTYELDKIEEF